MKSSISLEFFFSRDEYMIGVGFKILIPTPVPKLPRVPTHNHRGYKRVYKFKDQYMNRSTLCEIKYISIGCGYLKAVYMIGVDSKVLTCTPVPKLPEFTPTPSLKLFTFCLCKLCAIRF